MGDRRQILRQVQQQRQASRQPVQQIEDPRASLRPYNPLDFHDNPTDDDAPPIQDRDRTDVLKLVLYDLNSAIAPRSLRLMAIQSAMDEFDHDEEFLHDEELELRADHILLQKLAYAMSIDPSDEEVGYICAALEMVYRGGKKRLAKSFHEICDAILPMFVEMIKRPPYVEVVEEGVEEAKEEVIFPVEASEQEFRGIEPVEDYDPYATHVGVGEDDDESAESVTIPAGTGEYFDHMKKMAEMGDAANKNGVDTENALVPQPVNLNATGAMEPYNPQLQQGGQPPAQQQLQPGQQQQYTPEQLYELAQHIAKMQEAQRQQMVGVPPGAQPQYSAGAPQPAAAYNVPTGQMVPMQPGAQMGGQPGQPYPANMNNVQYSAGQPAGYTNQPYPGMHAPPNHAGQLVTQQTQFSQGQAGQQPLAPADSAALVPTQPSPEVVSATPQLNTMTVRDPTMTDEEALRLRGGGGDSVDGQDEYNDQGDYYDQNNYDGQDNYNDQGDYGDAGAGGRTALTDHFDQLYEEQNNFPSAASYDEYADADQSGRDENPFLDVSEVTGISELGSSMKRQEFKTRMNDEQDEAYNGQVPMNEGEYGDGEMEGEFGDDDYAQAAEKRFNGQVEADNDVRASNNYRDESEYADNEVRNYDEAAYDAQGNFASDYLEYLNNQAGPGGPQPEYDAQGNFSSDYSEYLNNEAVKFPQATDDGYEETEEMENGSNPFGYNDLNEEDESNRFRHQNGGVPVVQEYEGEDGFDESAVPVHIGEIPVDTQPVGGDGAIPSHIGPNPLSASMRSTGDLTFDTTLRNMDGHDSGFNVVAENLYQGNDIGGQGHASYTEEYDGNGYAHGMQGRHQTEDWSRGDERSGEYPIPKLRPEGEGRGEDYPRRDSELTGLTDDQWNSDRSDRHGTNLHMVQEESTTYTQDQHSESQSFTNGQVQQNTYDDDIFQFRAPTMAKPMASGDYLSSHRVGEGLVCPLAVKSVLKILRYFSRVLSAMEQLAQQPGLVDALLYQMMRNPQGDEDEDEISARVDAIAVLVNLACAEENKIMLVYHPGLLDAVINIANHDPIEEAREHAAIVMMNLAYAEENKVHMVNQDNLLDTLVHLLSDVSPFTRRYASAALFTLACTYANTAVMARHCDGGILEALRKVLLNDPVDEARVNAAEALFNMARNNSDDTVENMGNHPKLLASLAHSVLTDYSPDVRAYSARALEWLSADIHYPMQCHPRLLEALAKASQWTKTTCIAEALKMQASLSENRKSMVEHPGLLDALAQLSLLDGINDDEIKTCAIAALERLSKEPSTRHLMVRNEGVMTALTRATFDDNGYDDDEEDQAPSAVLMKTALKNLAEHM